MGSNDNEQVAENCPHTSADQIQTAVSEVTLSQAGNGMELYYFYQHCFQKQKADIGKQLFI